MAERLQSANNSPGGGRLRGCGNFRIGKLHLPWRTLVLADQARAGINDLVHTNDHAQSLPDRDCWEIELCFSVLHERSPAPDARRGEEEYISSDRCQVSFRRKKILGALNSSFIHTNGLLYA